MTRQEGPYGWDGDQGGEHALQLLENLLIPKTPMPFARGETPRWNEADQQGFLRLLELQSDMHCIDPSYEEEISTGELTNHWRDLTPALPFSEAERNWMVEAQLRHWRAHREKGPDFPLPESIVTEQAVVLSAGVREVVRGRDLVRRWAAWRREADEFAGQGSLTATLGLLDLMAHELVPADFAKPDFPERYPHVAEFATRAKPLS